MIARSLHSGVPLQLEPVWRIDPVNIQYVVAQDRARARRLLRAANPNAVRRRIASSVCSVVAGVILGAADFPRPWLAAVLGCLVIAGVINMWPRLFAKKRMAAIEPTSVTITETEFLASTSITRASVLWAGIVSVAENDGIWICRSADKVIRCVIFQQLIPPAELGELRMFLVGRGLLPQAYKIKI